MVDLNCPSEAMLDVAKLGRKHFVSQSGLAHVLQAVKEADSLPRGTSRWSVKRKREIAADIQTPYGPILKSWELEAVKHHAIKVDFFSPAAMVWYGATQCQAMASFVERRLQERPGSVAAPWGLIFYSDEITPGNQLKPNNSRKMQAVYYSFLEFGSDALCKDHAWFLLCALKSQTVAKLRDGMSQLCRKAIESFFAQDGNLAHGIQIGQHFLCAKMKMVVSDEAALKAMFQHKGASGKLPCVLCRNVVLRRYAPDDMAAPLVLRTCTDESRFLQHDLPSLLNLVRHLEARSTVLNKGQMSELETALGFNRAPLGVLSSEAVLDHMGPTKALLYDWMHCYVVGGLFQLEVNLLMGVLAEAKVKISDLDTFFQQFQWPKSLESKGAGAKKVFEHKKKAKDDEWKSSASEALSAFPVLRAWLDDFRKRPGMSEKVQGSIRSCLALCRVMVASGRFASFSSLSK